MAVPLGKSDFPLLKEDHHSVVYNHLQALQHIAVCLALVFKAFFAVRLARNLPSLFFTKQTAICSLDFSPISLVMLLVCQKCIKEMNTVNDRYRHDQ